jgi:hypothetical protein
VCAMRPSGGSKESKSGDLSPATGELSGLVVMAVGQKVIGMRSKESQERSDHMGLGCPGIKRDKQGTLERR